MVMTAPGLFSTTVFQPSSSASAVAMTRARMSGGVLVEVGTTIRMGFDGNDWASADRRGSDRPIAAAPVRKRRRFMETSIWCRAVRRRGAVAGAAGDRTVVHAAMIEYDEESIIS